MLMYMNKVSQNNAAFDELTEREKREIEEVVRRVVDEYGETLRLLARD